ncbi:ABC transporter permease [Paenibacillus marchantiophytorum]|uniref:ABC transporter permease n=1 Tax=Paenibacillus marchantiophytorum TaxID=1619310 RepID=A0ABQ1FIF7_9BACL|nr:sugar ABC transporter permease [Paenibacillus marchantiophytorum]GGA13345.1 ABC transporter permease [Paenibacillus marchantiophytorum]
MNKVLRNPYAYVLFVVPAMALYLTFYIVPMLNSLKYAVTSWNGINEATFNGLDNFVKAFHDEKFWIAFKNNIYFVLFSVFVQIPVIIFFSILISGAKRFLGFYKTTVFLPSVLSTAIIGVIWQFIYHPDAGLVNQLLRVVGLESWTHGWLGEEGYSMLAILVTNGWQWTGFYIVLVLAAIFAIPKEMQEAGEMDGAIGWRKARYITIPLIRPVILVVMMLSITGAMKALDIVFIMTKGGPFGSSEVMATYMYKQAYSMSLFGYANAISVIIFLFTVVLTVIFHFLTRRTEEVDY